jgi:hypothetical protein
MVGYSIVYLLENRETFDIAGGHLIQPLAGSEDIVIKVPVAVPYQIDWNAPEPAEGQLAHEGKFYQMKSKQLVSDTLIILCEYDQGTRERFYDLASKINDQVTGTADNPEKGSHSVILKNFLKEYMAQKRRHKFYVFEWTASDNITFSFLNPALPEKHAAIPSPPPDFV